MSHTRAITGTTVEFGSVRNAGSSSARDARTNGTVPSAFSAAASSTALALTPTGSVRSPRNASVNVPLSALPSVRSVRRWTGACRRSVSAAGSLPGVAAKVGVECTAAYTTVPFSTSTTTAPKASTIATTGCCGSGSPAKAAALGCCCTTR